MKKIVVKKRPSKRTKTKSSVTKYLRPVSHIESATASQKSGHNPSKAIVPSDRELDALIKKKVKDSRNRSIEDIYIECKCGKTWWIDYDSTPDECTRDIWRIWLGKVPGIWTDQDGNEIK